MSILDDRTQHAEDELTELQHRYDKLLAAAKAVCKEVQFTASGNSRLGKAVKQLRAAIEEAEPLQP